MMFSHNIMADGKTAIISAACPIDTRSAGDFKSHCEHLISKSITTLILDGSTVKYASSEGLYVLYQISQSAKSAGGAFIITNPSMELKVMLALLNLNEEFSIAESINSAMKKSQINSRENAGEIVSSEPDQKPSANNDLSAAHTDDMFDVPIVVECEECGAFVRVHSSGRFLCPSCNIEFAAEKDGTVIF